MADRVVVRKLKFDGTVKSEWDADLVSGTGGEWLVTLFDSERHAIRDDVPRTAGPQFFVLHYLNTVRPLSIQMPFSSAGRRDGDTKCDAALPARWNGRVIEFTDLDLDVMVNPDGTYYVRDVEDFEARSAAIGYTEEARQAAWKGVALALLLVKRKRYPFDGSAEALLGRVLAAQGPV